MPASLVSRAMRLTDLGIFAGIARHHIRELSLSCIQRMRNDPGPLRNLRYPITALGDLQHRITLETTAEMGLAHLRLLTSKLG